MRSANELSAMVLKAARGAGMSLGCAEELGRAAPEFAANRCLECLFEILDAPHDAPVYDGAVVSGGHPVQAITAWRDLRAAGLDVQLQCDLASDVVDAFCAQTRFVGPFDVDERLWQHLQGYAAKMLVPESEESRLAGAGAGLTDND